MKIKAISIRQPYAWKIFQPYGKDIENRTWSTSYRGPLLIHASSSRRNLKTPYFPDGEPVPDDVHFPLGAIVGIVTIWEVLAVEDILNGKVPRKSMSKSMEESICANPYANGPYLFFLGLPQAFSNPVRYPGELNIFSVDSSVLPKEALAYAKEHRLQ